MSVWAAQIRPAYYDFTNEVFALVRQMPDGVPVKTIARALQIDPEFAFRVVEGLIAAELVVRISPHSGKAPRIITNHATMKQWSCLYEEADRAFA